MLLKCLIQILARLQAFPFLLKWLAVSPLRISAFQDSVANLPRRFDDVSKSTSPLPRTLFHAASLGELEMLLPMIEVAQRLGHRIIVSVFSESAVSSFPKLADQVEWIGFSPRENEWVSFFYHWNIKKVFVAKYEAWPGLWFAAAQANAEIVVIEAKMRLSLRIIGLLFQFSGMELPSLVLAGSSADELDRLQESFPSAHTMEMDDPRWLRVWSRAQNVAGKWYELKSWLNGKKALVIGSAWREDLEILLPAIQKSKEMGKWQEIPILIFPHDLSQENMGQIAIAIQNHLKKIPDFWSAKNNGEDYVAPGSGVMVMDVMGMLAESYLLAKGIWIGGGFGKGVHSTIEAAIAGVPMACGPARIDSVNEIVELRRLGWLRVVRFENEVEQFLEWVNLPEPKEFKEHQSLWKEKVERLEVSILKLIGELEKK